MMRDHVKPEERINPRPPRRPSDPAGRIVVMLLIFIIVLTLMLAEAINRCGDHEKDVRSANDRAAVAEARLELYKPHDDMKCVNLPFDAGTFCIKPGRGI